LNRFELRSMQAFALPGLLLLVPIGVSSCRDHSPASRQPEKSSLPVVQPLVQTRIETEREKSCREFVQSFYDWYESPVERDPQHPSGTLDMDDVIRSRGQVLSGQLYTLLKAERDAQARAHELVGLDFDPFFNSQDPSSKFLVESVDVQLDHCNAVVNGVEGTQKRELVKPELVAIGESWAFVNFHYHFDFADKHPPQSDDLIHVLKLNAADRKAHPD